MIIRRQRIVCILEASVNMSVIVRATAHLPRLISDKWLLHASKTTIAHIILLTLALLKLKEWLHIGFHFRCNVILCDLCWVFCGLGSGEDVGAGGFGARDAVVVVEGCLLNVILHCIVIVILC